MLDGSRQEPPVEPCFAWFDGLFDDLLADDAREGVLGVVDMLGDRVDRLAVPPAFGRLVDVQRVIHEYEICHHLEDVFSSHWGMISDTLKPVIERGRAISETEYDEALQNMATAAEFFGTFFNDYDAVIVPGATGEAPAFGPGTGNPIFCTIWTLCGLPSVNLPILVGENGLPVGLQLVAAVEQDDRLMRTANRLLTEIQAQLA